MIDTDRNKQIVAQFYAAFFNGHDLSAADRYVKEDYIQHSNEAGPGREGLKIFFADMLSHMPTFHLDIQRMVAENDMVWVYLKNVAPDGHTICRVVDMYRLEDGMLAEHWDVIQAC